MSNNYLPIFALLIVGPAVAAAAQTTTEPQTPTEPQAPTAPQTPTGRTPRPYRGVFGGGPPVDPNRTRQELTMTLSGSGGYDSWISPAGPVEQIGPRQQRQSGFMGVADAVVNYHRGRAARGLSVEGRTNVTGYSDIDVAPLIGGNVRASFDTTVGRRGRFQATHNTGYQPTLVTGAFGPLATDVAPTTLPETGSNNGLVEQSSIISTSSVNLHREWTRRQSTETSVGYTNVNYLDNLGFDSKSWSATGGYTWNLSRRFALQPTYRFDDTTYQQSTEPISMTDHNVELIGSYTRRLSPSRQLEISGGGGATFVSTVNSITFAPVDYRMPSGRAALRLDLLRSWSITANYRRAVNVIQGVSLESFATDAASVQVDGLLTRRIQAMMLTAYSNGRSGGGLTTSRYESFSTSLRLRYALGRCCATTTEYDYYNYQFHDIVSLSPGIPQTFDRHAVRFGFTLWLPLYGRYVERNENGRR